MRRVGAGAQRQEPGQVSATVKPQSVPGTLLELWPFRTLPTSTLERLEALPVETLKAHIWLELFHRKGRCHAALDREAERLTGAARVLCV